MTLPASLLIHSLTWIVPATSTDAYNNTVRDYGAGATSTTITGRMQQDSAAEALAEGRDPQQRDWTLFTNTDGISGLDRIVFGSLTFEVTGPPAPTYGASGFHHAEVHLRLVEG